MSSEDNNPFTDPGNPEVYPEYAARLKKAFLPLLAALFSFLLCYCTVHWFLVAKWSSVRRAGKAAYVYAPLFFALVTSVVFLYRPVMRFDFGEKAVSATMAMLVVFGVIIFAPTHFALKYLEKRSGRITLNEAGQIADHPYFNYYSFNNYYIDTSGKGVWSRIYDPPGESAIYTCYVYVSYPLFKSRDQALAHAAPPAWACFLHSENYRTAGNRSGDMANVTQNALDHLGRMSFENITGFSQPAVGDEQTGCLEAIYQSKGGKYIQDYQILIPIYNVKESENDALISFFEILGAAIFIGGSVCLSNKLVGESCD